MLAQGTLLLGQIAHALVQLKELTWGARTLMVREDPANSTLTHLLVSRLSARFQINLKQSMVLLGAPHGFVYAWYAFGLHIASYTFYNQLFVLMASQMLTQPKASLFGWSMAL